MNLNAISKDLQSINFSCPSTCNSPRITQIICCYKLKQQREFLHNLEKITKETLYDYYKKR